MNNLYFTIFGYLVWLPWLISVVRTPYTRTEWHKQLLALCWAGFLTAFCFEPVTTYYFFGLVTFATILYCVKERPAFHLTPLAVIASCYWLYYFITLLWTPSVPKGTTWLVDTLPLIVLCWLPCWTHPSEQTKRSVLRTFVSAAGIMVVLSVSCWLISCHQLSMQPWQWPILQKASVAGFYSYDWVFRFIHYHHPTYNNLALCTAGVVAVYLSKNQDWKYKTGTLFMLIFITLTSLLIQSRIGLLFSGLMWFCLLFWLPSKKAMGLALISIMILGGAALYAIRQPLQQMGKDPVRAELTESTWQFIKVKPWTGTGVGALNPIVICHTINKPTWPHIGEISPTAKLEDCRTKTHMLPHNQWLADWAHGGLMAFIFAILLYATMGYSHIKKKDCYGIILLLIFCILSWLEPPLFIAKGMYLFGALAMGVTPSRSTWFT